MTITSLQDLELYLDKFSKTIEFHDEEMRSRYKLHNRVELIDVPEYMQKHLDLKNFIELNQKYDLSKLEIAYFNFSPYFSIKTDNFTQFIEAFEDPFFPKHFMEKHKMYQIGFYNSDIICITIGTDNYTPGEILFVDEGYDIFDPNDDQIHPLAPDFEMFLILAGNLRQIYDVSDSEDYDALQKEFEKRLKQLNIAPRYWESWLRLI